jgi:hypothetical protein
MDPPALPEAQAISGDQRRTFDQLRAEFLAVMQMPPGLECKLLKLASSFEAPPASEWAGLVEGGCAQRYLTLSRLNDLQEIVQIRGPATEWFCEVAERAGNALPADIPDCPILFDNIHRNEAGMPVGCRGPNPVMNRGPLQRWVGFVLATLKRHEHAALQVRWSTQMGPLSYGLATLDRDLCAASVLAIDLAGLTTPQAPTPSDTSPLVIEPAGPIPADNGNESIRPADAYVPSQAIVVEQPAPLIPGSPQRRKEPSEDAIAPTDATAVIGGSKSIPKLSVQPSASAAGGLFHFDLTTIFRCAVELGAALAVSVDDNEIHEAEKVNDPAAGGDVLRLPIRDLTSREAEIAADRLLHVLNPRQARFPSNWDWDYFQAHKESGATWTGGAEPRPGWRQELNLADASPTARRALLTIGLALADLRGDPQWRERGRELLCAGTWNLWEGLRSNDRHEARHLLSETHRIWSWPDDPASEPLPFNGPIATFADHRILSPGWRTCTTVALDRMQDAMRESNYFVDAIVLANGHFEMYRNDIHRSNAALPSICPKAAPKPPIEMLPEGDILAEIDTAYRSLRLIGCNQSMHWVGRQSSPATTCTCDLISSGIVAQTPEWQNLRQLDRAVRNLIASVRHWAGRELPHAYVAQIDSVGERVVGLLRALTWEQPRFPNLSLDQALRLRGPASLPVIMLENGTELMAGQRELHIWELEWRAILIGVKARLAVLDPRPLPCQAPVELQLDSREVPMDAPVGTPSPLREAFEAVAESLLQAADFRRNPPNWGLAFEEQACALSTALSTARARYASAELRLRAVTERDGHCAHQEALNAVSWINDACGHVMRNIVPPHRAVAHIFATPAIDVSQILGAMRRQTSRAAVQEQMAGGRPAFDSGRTEKTGDADPPTPTSVLSPPPDDAVKAYRLKWILGAPRQTEIAKRLTEELGRPISQGQVSRWLSQAEEFVKAGGVLPGLPNPPSKQPKSVDPERLDLGRRKDGRTERQRERRSEDD